jgi:hypothetical protein
MQRSSNIDLFSNRNDLLTLAYTDDTDTASMNLSDVLRLYKGTVKQQLAGPVANQITYRYSPNYVDSTWTQDVYDNAEDQAAAGGIIAEEPVQMYFVRDPDTALAVATKRAGYLGLDSFRFEAEIPLVPTLALELGDLVTIDHFGGIAAAGYDGEIFKVTELSMDIDNLQYNVKGIRIPQTEPDVQLPTPWAYYKFEEESGTRVDSTGNGHDLAVTENYPEFPAAHVADGLRENCLHSYEDNPSYDYSSWLEYTGGSETFAADTPWSFVFWWKGTNRGSENNGGLEIYFPPAEAVIDINSLTTSPFTAYIYMYVFWGAYEAEMELDAHAYDYTQWNMYTITFDGTYVKFYINETLVWTSGAIDISGESPLEWQDVLFTDGWYNGEGYLDEAVIFNDLALSTDQIEYIYNDGVGRNL